MKNLAGTQTLELLSKAFAGESQARTRYTLYAAEAIKSGLVYISNVFLETAENERAHAKIFMDLIIAGSQAGKINVNADYPLNIGTTAENLHYAYLGENEEHNTVYPAFADIAKNEGFTEVEMAFRNIAKIEGMHENRFKSLETDLNNYTLFKKDGIEYWICTNCGYVYQGNEAPKICPVCKYDQGYFRIMPNPY